LGGRKIIDSFLFRRGRREEPKKDKLVVGLNAVPQKE
jgi:hypothetical protein